MSKKWFLRDGRCFNLKEEEIFTRICSVCKQEKFLYEFKKASTGKYGVRGDCRECESNKGKAFRDSIENKERLLNKSKEYYYGNRENILKRHSEYKKINKETISAKNKQYNEVNRGRISEQKRIYREENYSKISAQKKNYYLRTRERKSEKSKQFYLDNKETIKKRVLKYRKTPQGREMSRRMSHKRRALKQQNGGSYTSIQWEECKVFFNNECAYSGQTITLENSHVEHIIPLSKGGTSYIWNLCTSLDKVNFSKNNSNMEEWYRRQEYFTEERLSKIYEWQEHSYRKYHKEYFSIDSIEK